METETLFNIDEYRDGVIGPNDVPIWLIAIENRRLFNKKKRNPDYHIKPRMTVEVEKKVTMKESKGMMKFKSKASDSFHEQIERILKIAKSKNPC